MARHAQVRVPLGAQAYDVVVADGFAGLGEAVRGVTGAKRALLVTDDRVGPLWADAAREALAAGGVEADVLVVPAGEAHKNVETWWSIVDGALRRGVRRSTPLVALGGGVVGDLVGFAAATILRGLPFVQVPTTLLAMVDSSVGGKTGFDHPLGKNLVGAFWQPRLVWAALETLGTLPDDELRSGLGEVVKTALLADATLTGRLLQRGGDVLATVADAADVVARCVSAKAAVVAADEREGGARASLNAGHTVGHAIEQVAGFGAIPHGEAVAIGLVAETRWAEREGLVAAPGLAEQVHGLVARLGLATEVPDLDREALVAAMRLDKKGGGDTLVLPVIEAVAAWRLVDLPLGRLPELLEP